MTLDERLDQIRATGAWINPDSEANLRHQCTPPHAYPARVIPTLEVDADGHLYYDRVFRATHKAGRQVVMDLVLPPPA